MIMNIEKGVSRFEKVNYTLSIWLERIAIAGVLAMILATMIDVIGAKVFHWPLPASTEIVYLAQIVAIAGALAISKIDGRHVRIELIDKLRQPALGIIHAIVAFIGIAFFIVLTWKSFDYAQSLHMNHEVTATAKIPIYPFAIWMGLCCLPMIMVLIRDFVTSILETKKR
jgi:TRAP-type C4-dicarboxylate transport system permease small subunit